jgi:hypothetical protein
MWISKAVTIAAGQSETPEIALNEEFPAGNIALTVGADADLAEVVTIHVAANIGGPYFMLQSGGADIILPASKATSLDPFVAGSVKLVSAGSVGATRTFILMAAPLK